MPARKHAKDHATRTVRSAEAPAPQRMRGRVIPVIAAVLLAAVAALAASAIRHNQRAELVEVDNGLAAGPGTGDVLRDMRVATFVEALPRSAAQRLANDLARYNATPMNAHPPARLSLGSATAAVRIAFWTDALGSHSAELQRELRRIRLHYTTEDVALEPHHFPRDGACNPSVTERPEPSVRCLAARALICLEPDPRAWAEASASLERPPSLKGPSVVGMNQLDAQFVPNPSPARIIEIASRSMAREALDACLASAESSRMLKDDVDLAASMAVKNAHIVIVNGRRANASARLLEVLLLTRAAGKHPAFKRLPHPEADQNAGAIAAEPGEEP